MLKRQNINLNSSGKVSCPLLLLLTFLLINPAATSAYAIEASGANPEETASADADAQISAQSEILTSSINIAFAPESGHASLTPISSDGASAKYSIKATVGVENSGGYMVYIGSNKSELTGKNTSVTINGVTSSTTYEELPLNSWGYNAEEGEVPGTTFSKVPTNNRGDIIGGNNSTNIKEDSKTFTLSFAAHIGNDMPADTYENEITLSVVSSPLEITGLTSIATMQEMTAEVCEASELGDETQLEDVRDGKYYWVAKLADGKCWMTQNLALDLNANTLPLTSETSDVSSSWTPKNGSTTLYTATTASPSTILADNTGQRSWNLGSYYIKTPNGTTSCGTGKNSLANCTNYFTALSAPTTADKNISAHYLAGNYYQWNAATAGTGKVITSGQATDSICPKGWRLPTSKTGGEFQVLVNAYNMADSTTSGDTINLVSAPLYFVRSGYVDQSANGLFSGAGGSGVHWSSIPVSDVGSSYLLYFTGSDSVNPSNAGNRQRGRSVRCVAR